MTPQQIVDYKHTWMPGFRVKLHTDLRREGVNWCKDNLIPAVWSDKRWIEPYYDEFRFENKVDANKFAVIFYKYVIVSF